MVVKVAEKALDRRQAFLPLCVRCQAKAKAKARKARHGLDFTMWTGAAEVSKRSQHTSLGEWTGILAIAAKS